MSSQNPGDTAYCRDLGNGLLLRWSTPADAEAIADLYGHVFRDKPGDPMNSLIVAWTRDLASGRHPLCNAGDFALVEDRRRGTVVAATVLLRQSVEYGGVSLGFGRPEIVASHPDYRRQGLVRAVFDLIHARSEAEGHLAQGITGIPYYYRQFGYEYALDLGGSRNVAFDAIPSLKEGQVELYRLRPATLSDLPVLRTLYDAERSRRHAGESLLASTVLDDVYWRWSLEGARPEAGVGWESHMLVGEDERVVGYLLLRRIRWGDGPMVCGFWVGSGTSMMAVLPSTMRALKALAPSMPTPRPEAPPPKLIVWELGRTHPVYDALGETMAPRLSPPYGWYVRVPDLPRFMRHIAPVLEQRLASSVLAGHSGELKIDFYRGGLRMVFTAGTLETAEEWRPPIWEAGTNAGFPPLVFLQLLWGRRSLMELRHAFPDVWADDASTTLLNVLFPPLPSWILPLD